MTTSRLATSKVYSAFFRTTSPEPAGNEGVLFGGTRTGRANLGEFFASVSF
jgi:hypothetical protein